jgi:hypothetical protein
MDKIFRHYKQNKNSKCRDYTNFFILFLLLLLIGIYSLYRDLDRTKPNLVSISASEILDSSYNLTPVKIDLDYSFLRNKFPNRKVKEPSLFNNINNNFYYVKTRVDAKEIPREKVYIKKPNNIPLKVPIFTKKKTESKITHIKSQSINELQNLTELANQVDIELNEIKALEENLNVLH